MIKNKIVSLVYKIITAVLALTGLLFATDIFTGTFSKTFIFYYTNQSNILCLVSMVLSAIYCAKDIKKNGTKGLSTFAPRFKGGVVLAITVTFLVYWGMLYSPGYPQDISSILLHLVVPVMVILDWVLFDEKGKFKKLDPILWLLIPLVYDIFANVVALFGSPRFDGSRFPYFFLDYDLNGIPMTIMYFVVLLLTFLLLGYVYYGLSQLMSRKQRKIMQEQTQK